MSHSITERTPLEMFFRRKTRTQPMVSYEGGMKTEKITLKRVRDKKTKEYIKRKHKKRCNMPQDRSWNRIARKNRKRKFSIGQLSRGFNRKATMYI